MPEADWIQDAVAQIPNDLATGCYADFESTGVMADCAGRIPHDEILNKGTSSTSRSKIDDNFAHAVTLAERDISRQWEDFEEALRRTYPSNGRGATMICALTHDDPVSDCVR